MDARFEASDSRTDFRVVPTESRTQSATAHSRTVVPHLRTNQYLLKKIKTKLQEIRPEILENAPLHYAPINEFGVVYLFASIAPKLKIRVEEIRAAFPDCIAYQKAGNKEKRLRIEFEFKSRNFKTHKHNPDECDWIVCWEDNWSECPEHIEVFELKNYFGFGKQVWILPVKADQTDFLNEKSCNWSISANSSIGDILLMYRSSKEKAITDIYIRTGNLFKEEATWRKGTACYAEVKHLCHLKSPIFWEDLKNDRILKTAPFVLRKLQGVENNASEYWFFLYDKIIKRNPTLEKKLNKYSPEKL